MGVKIGTLAREHSMKEVESWKMMALMGKDRVFQVEEHKHLRSEGKRRHWEPAELS